MNNPASSLHTRPSLLLRIRDAQDTDAWQTFMSIYAPLIYRYCRGRGLQDADAADVTQEVLAKVARSVQTFTYQPERGRFRDWLGTVTRHRIFRFLRRQHTGLQAAEAATEQDAEEIAAPQAEAEWTAVFHSQLLQAALERIQPSFEPVSWRAFERTWIEDRPAAEVSRELDLRIEAVYLAKTRVLKKLREEVLHLAEDLPQLFAPR